MQKVPCPDCGQQRSSEAMSCEKCGHPATNGTLAKPEPPPPPEAADWIIYPTPPEIREEMQRTFNEEEFLAEWRKAEQAGLPELKDSDERTRAGNVFP